MRYNIVKELKSDKIHIMTSDSAYKFLCGDQKLYLDKKTTVIQVINKQEMCEKCRQRITSIINRNSEMRRIWADLLKALAQRVV